MKAYRPASKIPWLGLVLLATPLPVRGRAADPRNDAAEGLRAGKNFLATPAVRAKE